MGRALKQNIFRTLGEDLIDPVAFLNETKVYVMSWNQDDKGSRYEWVSDFPQATAPTTIVGGTAAGGTRNTFMNYRQEGGYIDRLVAGPGGMNAFEAGSPAYLRNQFSDNFDYTGMQMHDGAGNDIPFFISAWIYPTDLTNTTTFNQQMIFSNYGINTTEFGWYLRTMNSNGRVQLVQYSTGSFQQGYIASSALTLNSWNHVVMSYNGDKNASVFKGWINGVEQVASAGSSSVYTGMQNTLHYTSPSNASGANNTHYQGRLGQQFVGKSKEANQAIVDYLYNSGNGRPYPFT